MKKILLILAFAFSLTSKAADSTNVTIAWQVRDVEYAASLIYGNEFYENLTDTMRVKYRQANKPTALQTLPITGYSKDFIEVLKALKNDITSKANNVDSRLKTLLNALNDSYINEKISLMDAGEQSQFTTAKTYGKFRLTRRRN